MNDNVDYGEGYDAGYARAQDDTYAIIADVLADLMPIAIDGELTSLGAFDIWKDAVGRLAEVFNNMDSKFNGYKFTEACYKR